VRDIPSIKLGIEISFSGSQNSVAFYGQCGYGCVFQGGQLSIFAVPTQLQAFLACVQDSFTQHYSVVCFQTPWALQTPKSAQMPKWHPCVTYVTKILLSPGLSLGMMNDGEAYGDDEGHMWPTAACWSISVFHLA